MTDAKPPPITPDAEIVAKAKQGDVHAYGVLVQRYERAAFAAAFALIQDRHEAEDVVQEAFTQAYIKLGTLRDGSRFAYWLLRIARRQASRAMKQRSRRRDLLIRSADPIGSDADDRLLDEDRQRLLRHVHGLPAHERLTVSLRYFDGHSVREIAEMTGCAVGTVTKRLTRATRRLRRSMESESKR